MPVALDVRLDGYDKPIGYLVGDDRRAVAFGYAPDYLRNPAAIPLSMSLPLGEATFGDFASRAYFENLLQERDADRAAIIDKYKLATDDLAAILYHLGRDCTGAVSALPQGAPPIKVPGDLTRDYEAFDDDLLVRIVRSLHERNALPDELRKPSPLAGVQSKIAVALLPDGRLGQARDDSGAPTTHILKVPNWRHRRDARTEHCAMQMAGKFGHPTAETALRTVDDIEVLLVTRFDRDRDAAGRVVRRHQEDFCQALGLSSRQKYERPDQGEKGYSAAAVETILQKTVDPLLEHQRFIEITAFDILIGNVDGHAKNFSLFHLPANRLVTTPRYDVMPTMLDRQTTNEFAYRLGTAESLAQLTPDSYVAFLADMGLAATPARRMTASVMDKVTSFLDSHLEEIEDTGEKDFADLVATNIRTLARNFGFTTPPHAAQRDTFVR